MACITLNGHISKPCWLTLRPFSHGLAQWTICTIIAWVRDGASGDGRSVTCIMISVFPTSRKLFFLSPFRTVLNAIHMQVTDRLSPDAPSLTQAIIVQMVYCLLMAEHFVIKLGVHMNTIVHSSVYFIAWTSAIGTDFMCFFTEWARAHRAHRGVWQVFVYGRRVTLS